MMEGRPIKFRVLEVLCNADEIWSNDIVTQLQDEYQMNNNYGRDCLNFDLIEMEASGMIREIDAMIDEDGVFRKGALLHKYRITQLGRDLNADLQTKVKGGKAI
jgi:hypothetical protein